MSLRVPIQVSCFPPLGKPAKDANYFLGDARPRIAQPPQKENTCWFYSLIAAGRERFGPTAPKELQGRADEILISSYRKQCSALDKQEKKLKREIQIVTVFISQFSEIEFTKQSVEICATNTKKIVENLSKTESRTETQTHDLVRLKNLLTYFQEFISQSEVSDLRHYPNYLLQKISHSRIAVFKQYLQHRNIPLSAVDALIQANASSIATATVHSTLVSRGINPSCAPAAVKANLIAKNLENTSFVTNSSLVQKTSFEAVIHKDIRHRFGFKEAIWDPSKSFDFLIQSLEDHGPHCVNGFFGKSWYKEPPFELKDKFENRKVCGWKKETALKIAPGSPNTESSHNVVLVGGKRDSEGKEFVYFIDPEDGSDPANPDSQKVYVITYKRLTDNSRNFEGVSDIIKRDLTTGHLEYENINLVPSEETGLHYAYYREQYKKH